MQGQQHSQWFVGYFLFAWGAILLFPGSTFKTSFSYSVLGSMMNESGWGLLALGIGFIYLISCWYSRFVIQKYSLYLALCYWVIVTMSFFFANPISTANIMYLGVAAHCKLAATETQKKIHAAKEGVDDE